MKDTITRLNLVGLVFCVVGIAGFHSVYQNKNLIRQEYLRRQPELTRECIDKADEFIDDNLQERLLNIIYGGTLGVGLGLMTSKGRK